MGVAEMRERKMAGQGLPSPQVSFLEFRLPLPRYVFEPSTAVCP
jgi:hypothetical protein